MDFYKTKEEVGILDYSYLPTWVHKPNKYPDGSHFVILPGKNTDLISKKMNLSRADLKQMEVFLKDTKTHLNELKITEFKFK